MNMKIRRVHALKNTYSGVTGEMRVASELLRCGIKVARPYWTDDEADLLVLTTVDKVLVPIVIQVKSIQFVPKRNKEPKYGYVQGLRKKYIEESPAISLAIYRADKDDIYIIFGRDEIKKQYKSQNSRTSYEDLKPDNDVRIKVMNDGSNLKAWKVPKDDAKWLSEKVGKLAKEAVRNRNYISELSRIFASPLSAPS